MLYQNFAHFVVQAIFDSQLFHHALPHALCHRFRSFALNEIAFDEPLYDFRGHMADIIPYEQHSERVLYSQLSAPTAFSNFREKQFTGSPNKVQLAAADKKFHAPPQFVDAPRCVLYDELHRAVSSVG
jgi:hypothetical protein